jgi:hypothetical protein
MQVSIWSVVGALVLVGLVLAIVVLMFARRH